MRQFYLIMALTLLFISAFLLYGKSKYFPKQLQDKTSWLKRYSNQARLVSYGLMTVALCWLMFIYDGFTGLTIWISGLMLVFSTLVIGLPLLYKH